MISVNEYKIIHGHYFVLLIVIDLTARILFLMQESFYLPMGFRKHTEGI